MNFLWAFAMAHPVIGLIALALGLFIGFIAASAIYRAAVQLALAGTEAVLTGAESATTAISDGIVALVAGAARLMGVALWFAVRPFANAWELTRDYTVALHDAMTAHIDRERQLRALFRASSFRTWREFRANFDGGGQDEAPRGEAPDEGRAEDFAFTAACQLLGLPLTGLFTQAALNAAFRKLMQKAHPDRAGNPGNAARLNAARDLIRKRQGWN